MFKHIYVEEKALSNERTKKLLAKFPESTIIKIHHYKDVFNRRGQSFAAQKRDQSLIIAINEGELVFDGARTCQDFGSDSFYYTSQIKNCLYDCEYCYLQGMYPSGNIVIFVNIEDYFKEIDRLTSEKAITLSIAYDTDLLAFEALTGFVTKWCDYAAGNPRVQIEIRTKCGSLTIFDKVKIPDNVVMAYTISPPEIASAYEHGASSYESRKSAVYRSLELGIKTRLCFDPVIPVKNFESVYGNMLDDILAGPNMDKVQDISIGSFRVSKEFIKAMQKVRLSPLTAYPYEIKNGICTFDENKLEKMTGFIKSKLLEKYPAEKLFVWE